MKTITLENMLKAQGDLGDKSVMEICNLELLGMYEPSKDPISDIIVNAFNNNENGTDLDGIENDLDYAIGQLTRCKNAVSKANS